MRKLNLLLLIHLALIAAPRHISAADPYADGNPWWILIHEPAVLDELDLGDSQRKSYRKTLDALDLRYFPLRNQSRDKALAGLSEIVSDAKQGLAKILRPEQNRRLQQLLLWRLGPASLLQQDVANALRLDESQQTKISEVLGESHATVAAIQKKLAEGQPREPLEKEFESHKQAEQRKLLELLTPHQRQAFRDQLGDPFDLTRLGFPAFKAPELIDGGEWINTPPITLASQRGKVVMLHFYAFGCINCIHNYPTYLAWQEAFKGKEVVLIGIHTPETTGERDSENVRRKAEEAKFEFPILIDGKSENWNAWGNSMWPSIYVIDREGYLRLFWPGELKWQGATGDKYVENGIERLLAMPSKPSPIANGRPLR